MEQSVTNFNNLSLSVTFCHSLSLSLTIFHQAEPIVNNQKTLKKSVTDTHSDRQTDSVTNMARPGEACASKNNNNN